MLNKLKKPFSIKRLNEILEKMHTITVGVVGDVCLDIYWYANMRASSLSLETPHYTLPIIKEDSFLGAAGNVATNLKELQVNVELCSIVGNDWRSYLIKENMKNIGISSDYLIYSDEISTPAYCKPMRCGISDVIYEDPRLDFFNNMPISSDLEDKVIKNIEKLALSVDAIIVLDQLSNGVCTSKIVDLISKLGKEGKIIGVDSRANINNFSNVLLKPNDLELISALKQIDVSQVTPLTDIKQLKELGKEFANLKKTNVVVTAGDLGAFWFNEEQEVFVPTMPAQGKIDIVGCGDTFMSTLIASHVLNVSYEESLVLANLASGVTVKKIGVTGSASPLEIKRQFKEVYE